MKNNYPAQYPQLLISPDSLFLYQHFFNSSFALSFFIDPLNFWGRTAQPLWFFSRRWWYQGRASHLCDLCCETLTLLPSLPHKKSQKYHLNHYCSLWFNFIPLLNSYSYLQQSPVKWSWLTLDIYEFLMERAHPQIQHLSLQLGCR